MRSPRAKLQEATAARRALFLMAAQHHEEDITYGHCGDGRQAWASRPTALIILNVLLALLMDWLPAIRRSSRTFRKMELSGVRPIHDARLQTVVAVMSSLWCCAAMRKSARRAAVASCSLERGDGSA